jgi:hypothetical protein
MEKRLNKKASQYASNLKSSLITEIEQTCNVKTDEIANLIEYIHKYEKLSYTNHDFVKPHRHKTNISQFERCCSKKADSSQCTRRKMPNSDFCGTHIKGTPHGVINPNIEPVVETVKKITVSTININGIIYYIDNIENVYCVEDVINNKLNPKIIAKYIKNNDNTFELINIKL